MTFRLLGAMAGSAAAMGLATTAFADEGMWTFDNFPAAKVKAAYGLDISPTWLSHVRSAAVRLSSGCSGSVVTRTGLVLTNNHCVEDCAQNLSVVGQDYFKSGYLAVKREEEKTCPGMQAEILTSITDVTQRVSAAGAGLSGQQLVKARTAVSSTIENESCAKDLKFKCQVVDLYHGGQFKLYRYRKYADVRVVFLPGSQVGFFGGDPDNFNFPRYDLDSAFLRLYDGGAPADMPNHLRWTAAAPTDGEPVFVAGNPGGTDRQLTVAQLETQRDLLLPITLGQYSELRGRLIRFGEEGSEHHRMAGDLLFGLENSYKVYYGRQQALNDPALLVEKRRSEADLKAKAGLAAGDPWGDIAEAQKRLANLYLPYRQVERGPLGSKLFTFAKDLVRAAQERQKPSADRLPGFADSQLALLEKEVLDPSPIEAPLEQLTLEFWLSKSRESLTVDDPDAKLLLGHDSPEHLSTVLATSTLGDPAVRKALWTGGLKAVQASSDPMIQYVLRIDPAARKIRSAYDEQVVGPVAQAGEKIAHARFKIYGDSLYPDATFTLRLSYGAIKGWTYRGQTVPPFTVFKGLFERATGQEPFELNPLWLAAKDKLNPDTIFNLATTNDIIGGNSGSPLINGKGEVIGAVFDGNIHSLGGDYGYDGALNRGVAVSTGAVTEALSKVYRADALVKELLSPR